MDVGTHRGGGLLAKTDEQLLVKALDPEAIEAIQRYVETERVKTRRMVLFTGLAFITVSLLILVLFVVISIYAINRMRQAQDAVETMSSQTALYAEEMVSVSNTLATLESRSGDIDRRIQDREAEYGVREERLKGDLQKFSKWVADSKERDAAVMAGMASKVQVMEQTLAARDTELKVMREKYQALSTTVLAVAVAPPLPPVAPVVPVTPVVAGATVTAGQTQPVAVAVSPEVAVGSFEQGFTNAALDVFQENEVMARTTPVALEVPESQIRSVTFPNGDIYRGSYKDGLFDGWGTYKYRNGDTYEGGFMNDMKDGKGTFKYINSDRYVGEFQHDMKNGLGTYFFANSDRYVGEFRNDMINGKGTLTYQNGNKYAGDFKDGMKHGSGVFNFSNGDVYRGEFKEDLRDGRGIYEFADGSRYVGEFRGGLRHGMGRYIYAGGEEYIGEFKDGKRNGRGTCIYPTGARLEALWRDDQIVEQTGAGN